MLLLIILYIKFSKNIYQFLLTLSNISYNFLALYIGSTISKDNNPLGKLPKIVLAYYSLTILCLIILICYVKNFSYRDILGLIFPISRNIYPFASSLLPCYIFGSPLAKKINLWSDKQKQAITFILVWFIIVSPLVFGQNIWSISSGTNIVWISLLFILGILWNNPNKTHKILKDLIILLVFLGITWIIIKYLPTIQNPTNFEKNILSQYSILSFLISVITFNIYKNINNENTYANLNLLIFNTYFLIHTPIFANFIKVNWSIETNTSFKHWSIAITKNILYIYLSVLFSFFAIKFILQLPIFKKIIKKYNITDSSDLVSLFNNCKKIIFENKRLILITLIIYFLTVIQFLVVRATEAKVNIDLLNSVILYQGSKIFITCLIYLAVFYLLYILTNKYIYSVSIIILVSTLITVAEYLKMTIRNEPILHSDLVFISNLPEIMSLVNHGTIYTVIGSIIVLLAVTVIVSRKIEPKMKYRHPIIKRRILTFLLALSFLVIIFWKNDSNTIRTMVFKAIQYQDTPWDITGSAKINGPILQFANDFIGSPMKKPANYNETTIKNIERKYTKVANKINQQRTNSLKNQTVVFILSESFSDPSRIPGLNIDHNPIPFITNLKQQTSSGLMVSSGLGGGTANMEWQALSGMAQGNLVPNAGTPYYQIVPEQQIAPNITNLFDNKIAIHPYTANLYNRIGVFNKYGFQHFYHIDSKDKLSFTDRLGNSSVISDESAYEELLKQITNNSGSTFIQLSTMQNHQPYDIAKYDQNDFKIGGAAVTSENNSKIEGYIEGISKTDVALKNFIDKINQIDKPITVVWYGDHLPGIYSNLNPQKDALTMHETDYFIYSNRSTVKLDNPIVGPYEFPALALEVGNNKVTPYYALLTEVSKELPTISTNITGADIGSDSLLINQDNKFIKENDLTPKQQQLLHDYRLIQYDLLIGKQFGAQWAQQKIK